MRSVLPGVINLLLLDDMQQRCGVQSSELDLTALQVPESFRLFEEPVAQSLWSPELDTVSGSTVTMLREI
jgi:hypothetical protein